MELTLKKELAVSKKKKVKFIKIDVDKCHGCRACEVACSAFHAKPKYSTINPARSRIRVFRDELRNVFVPVYASFYTKAECAGRRVYIAEQKEHSPERGEYVECSFCGAACPSRDLFFEPDSGLPVKCDMCEDDPPIETPWCVKVCPVGALVVEEKEVEESEREQEKEEELEVGVESLIDKYGLDKVVDFIVKKVQK